MGQTVNSKATEITNPAGLRFYGYKISPDGDYWISYSNLINALTVQINNLQTQINNTQKKQKSENISTAQTFTIPAKAKVTSVDFLEISGTPLIKVGSSIGLDDYIPEHEIVGADINIIQLLVPVSTVMYISISGGTVNYTITYEENHIL